MERNICFSERPGVMSRGPVSIVPLNVREDVIEDCGEVRRVWIADLVEVKRGETDADAIVEAAVSSEYDAKTQGRILRKIATGTEDAETLEYRALVREVTTWAEGMK